MSDISDLKYELAQLAELIAHNRGKLKLDKLIDVSGLPERTNALCQRLADLPKEDGVALEPGMRVIIQALDILAEDISHQQQSLIQVLSEM